MLELLYQDGELSKKYLKKGEKLAKENLGAVKVESTRPFSVKPSLHRRSISHRAKV